MHQTFDRSHNLEEEFHFQRMRTKGNRPWEIRIIIYVALKLKVDMGCLQETWVDAKDTFI